MYCVEDNTVCLALELASRMNGTVGTRDSITKNSLKKYYEDVPYAADDCQD